MEALYIVISATMGKMGKFIRFMTRAQYSHVSVACSEDLHDLVSFARRYYHAPFYGGFIHEGPERYCWDGAYAQAMVYRIPLEPEQAQAVRQELAAMEAAPEQYIYHLPDAALGLFRRHSNIPDAYICLSFALKILGYTDVLPPEPVYKIPVLAEILEPYRVYTGSIGDFALSSEPDYYWEISLRRSASLTARQCAQLWTRWRAARSETRSEDGAYIFSTKNKN